MFYRFVGLRRKAIDLDNLYQGACVLVGGGPHHIEVLDQLKDDRLLTLALNNTAVSFRPTMWIGLDGADNYSKSILKNPTIMKFTKLSRMGCLIDGSKWRTMPNTYFFPDRTESNMKGFFMRGKYLGWWKSGFTGALQLLYRLGFNTVYTVGCGFKISATDQYGFPSNLTDEQVAYNQRTYDMTLRQMRELQPMAIEANFQLISCTPDSALNDIVPYRPFDEVFNEMVSRVPAHDSVNVTHPKAPTQVTVPVQPSPSDKPRATVMIPTFNRDELLDLGLQSLAKQKLDGIERLVLNDGLHSEQTKKIAETHGATYVHTGARFKTSEDTKNKDLWRVPGFAYNIGAKMAHGDVLVLMCPEMWSMEPDTLEQVIAPVLENPKNVGIPFGKDDDGRFLQALQSDRSHADMSLYAQLTDLRTELPFLLAVSRQSYLDIGGYDEDFLGRSYDDDDFIDRLKMSGHAFVHTEAHCVHLFHGRVKIQEDRGRFNLNRKLYQERKGQIVRNEEREWGVLK